MILVIGQNSVWQRTILFERVERGEVNRARKVLAFPSGKGLNVVRALHSLSADGYLIGYAGGMTGMRFAREVEREGLPASFVEINNETRICSTIIETDGTVTELVEPAPSITKDEREAFESLLEEGIEKATVLVISGTAVKGEDPLIYKRAVEKAHEKKIPVILDSYTAESRKALEASPEILKINFRELKDLLEIREDISTPTMRKQYYEKLIKDYGIRWIVITNGKEGAEAFNGRDFMAALPPEVSVVNSIGSGDCFSAGLAINLEKAGIDGIDMGKALREATAMATANCLNLIPGKIERKEYDEILEKIETASYL